MIVIILSGGLGTRLSCLINDRPKPMVPIANKPFLEYLILKLKSYGLTDILLCIGHLGAHIHEYFGDGSKWVVHISYSYERKPLGTGREIKLAEGLIKANSLLVMNGDSFLEVDFNRLIEFNFEKEALATMALVEVEDPRRYGSVEVNENWEVKNFLEKEGTQNQG